jgi:hypothetical protein
MSHALLLVPDFLLILCGFALCRWTALGRGVWDGVERLVYYILFPVLLFNSIVKTPLQPGATMRGCMLPAHRRRSASIRSSRWRWPSGWAARRA